MGFDLLTSTIISVCSCVTGVAAVVALAITLGRKVKSPAEEQDRRITLCEEGIKEIRLKLDKDLIRLNHLEYGDRVTQKALLALLRHGIDGNDIDAMRAARDELDEYLVGNNRL